MHQCPNCRRPLRIAIRDALCLECLVSIDRDEFGDEPTRRGIIPVGVRVSHQAGEHTP